MDEHRSSFDSTIMSIIRGAADGDTEAAREYVDRFFRYYGTPLHAYLMRSCQLSAEKAEDVLHQFVLDKLLCVDQARNVAHRFLEKREKEPTLKFRAYLIRSLKNYVISLSRKKRPASLSLMEAEDALAESASPQEEDQFSREWAQHLLREAIDQVRDQCLSRPGQETIWHVFEARVVTPVDKGKLPEPYDQLAARLAIESPKQAANRLQTAMRKLKAALQRLVKEYLPTRGTVCDKLVQEEIVDLLRVASAQSPLRVLEQVARWEDSSWLPTKGYDDVCRADDLWSESDHAGIWQHLIQLPIAEWVAEFDDRLARQFADQDGWGGHRFQHLTDLWRHPDPPLQLLQAIKEYPKTTAKSAKTSEASSGLPTVINAVLYLSAIGTAWVRLGQRISRDSDRHFRTRLAKVLSLPWLDDATRGVLQDWLAALSESE